MDSGRFDALTRRVGTRRGILAAALGGVPLLGPLADATAKKRRRRRRCRIRVAKLRADTCAIFYMRSCRGKKDVTRRAKCQAGKICLSNNSCGLTCAATDDCPAEGGCTCSTSAPRVCLAAFTTCDDVPTTCETTADCPLYAVCEETDCGGGTTEKRCRTLCGHAPVV